MAKPLPRVIKTDDCVVTVNGEKYTPHEGEQISIRPTMPVGDLEKLTEFYTLASDMQSGEVVDAQDNLKRVAHLFDDATSILSRHIIDWTWTDDQGEPLPHPYKNPAAIKELSSEEVFYLLNLAMNGEAKVEEKNVGDALPTI